MKLARAIHFDESDMNVFHSPARTGEWCISGGFEFSNWGEADLTGKARQAFANGWVGLETSGRVTFVAVTLIEPEEVAELTTLLARHFVTFYGAPSEEAARPVAATSATARPPSNASPRSPGAPHEPAIIGRSPSKRTTSAASPLNS